MAIKLDILDSSGAKVLYRVEARDVCGQWWFALPGTGGGEFWIWDDPSGGPHLQSDGTFQTDVSCISFDCATCENPGCSRPDIVDMSTYSIGSNS